MEPNVNSTEHGTGRSTEKGISTLQCTPINIERCLPADLYCEYTSGAGSTLSTGNNKLFLRPVEEEDFMTTTHWLCVCVRTRLQSINSYSPLRRNKVTEKCLPPRNNFRSQLRVLHSADRSLVEIGSVFVLKTEEMQEMNETQGTNSFGPKQGRLAAVQLQPTLQGLRDAACSAIRENKVSERGKQGSRAAS
ncbi:hypothetical protein F2P81_020803 [Scophthalmus maximus]|uniref:Uncharacterized protein n=1 Tax=Scophthalmus maximus TaxID=52904 RepID=A0A6A4RTR1_SCOMX|nr:hypothetical protein F2P81_020803 [Scophthalmus maximus]